MTTLLHERGTLGFALTAALEVGVDRLIDVAREHVNGDAVARDRVAQEWIELQALRYTNYRVARHVSAHRHPRPRGLGDQAALVGAEPAHDEARSRAARRGRDPRRRLVALPAAPKPRQHDRGRHVGGPPQHRRRARARPSEGTVAMDFALTAGAAGAEERRARVALRAVSARPRLRRTAGRSLGRARRARLARRVALRGRGRRRPRLRRGGADPRGAGLCALPRPLSRDDRLRAAGARPGGAGRGRRGHARSGRPRSTASCRGSAPSTTSSAATAAAHAGGGEEIASVDPDRPVGRLEAGSGTPLAGAGQHPARPRRGWPPRPSASRSACSSSRSRTCRRASSSAGRSASTRPSRTSSSNTYADVELARSLAYWAAWCVAEDDEQASGRRRGGEGLRAEAAVTACERSIQVHGGTGFTWEHPLHRFYKRALWLHGHRAARPTALRAEIADAVIGAPVTA